MNPMATAQSAANKFHEIGGRLARVVAYAEDARTALIEAGRLLREDTDVTEMLFAGVSTLVPQRADRLPGVGIDAAGQLVAKLFSGDPMLPGAIVAARDLVASVYPLRPPVFGMLQDARRDLRIIAEIHAHASNLFGLCSARLGVHQGGDRWLMWLLFKDVAVDQANEAKQMVTSAILHAEVADRLLLICHREGRQSDAADTLHDAIEELEAALEAVGLTRDSIAHQEQIVRNAIDDAPGPAP